MPFGSFLKYIRATKYLKPYRLSKKPGFTADPFLLDSYFLQ